MMPTRRAALATFVALLAMSLVVPAARQSLDVDRGANGTWQRLLKLQTTASVLQIAAHPDEEAGPVMAYLSRVEGARVDALTLTRGEAGDNAVGPQAFDALGLLRTEELRIANRYYGVDEQFFTTFADLGFTKRTDEALVRWGRREVLGEVVRVVRASRPLVLFSRFQGTAQDGHGSTAASTLLMREAFTAAADPMMYPEHLRDGLRPWQALRVYIGTRADGPWTVALDVGRFAPWLGQSPGALARRGLGFQRSSVSAANQRRSYRAPGPDPHYFVRLAPGAAADVTETGFFDGIDTSIPAVFALLGKTEPPAARAQLTPIAVAAASALSRFSAREPWTVVPILAAGLRATRQALTTFGDFDLDVRSVLMVKERQFQDAINTALALDLVADAVPTGAAGAADGVASPPPAMAPPVPGQSFAVVVRATNSSPLTVWPTAIALAPDRGWAVSERALPLGPLRLNESATRRFAVTLAADVGISSRPYFSRATILDARYVVAEPSQLGQPSATPAARAVLSYTVDGVTVDETAVVRRREPQRPYGEAPRELSVVPALSVRLSPANIVVPRPGRGYVDLTVDLENHRDGPIGGRVSLTLPTGWEAEPVTHSFAFASAGQRQEHAFRVRVHRLQAQAYSVTATALVDGRRYGEGYDLIDLPDLEPRYHYRAATSQIRGIDVVTVPGLRVGYVMGTGDVVPQALRQLDASVVLLAPADLATGNLAAFDTIVIGTRAYAVRDDLRTYNHRLLDYARRGGNLVVLFNTRELVPDRFAPFAGELPATAEEVSEEDAPVEILAPDHQALRWPNPIDVADFDGWIEQRGSKFWARWDPAYTPVISSHDTGQAPQHGGWLTARYGKGTWTYFAYALHRQLAYGVPGAYRITANLLALGRPAPR